MHTDSHNAPSTIIHYHYHYLQPHAQTLPLHSLNKVKSHPNINIHLRSSNVTGSESASSQRSWKQFINRQYQSTINPKKRVFQGTAREQAHHMLNQPYLTPKKQLYSSNSQSNLSFLNTSSKLKSSTLTPFHKCQAYRPNFQVNNKQFSEIQKSSLDQVTINPEYMKNKITKKGHKESPQIRIGQQSKRQSTEQRFAYKLALLEEQCAFLRSKFLQHYVHKHHHRQG